MDHINNNDAVQKELKDIRALFNQMEDDSWITISKKEVMEKFL